MYVGCLTYISVLTTVQERPIYMGLIGFVWWVIIRLDVPTVPLLISPQGSGNDFRTSCKYATQRIPIWQLIEGNRLAEPLLTATQRGDG